MKGDTPLDYAVFQLSDSQTRCELWICAGERNEKLASGSFKPFLANLRAAKEQLVKDASFIILQAPPFVGDGSPWFTKRTVEMFVRFVSTPDVLEGVSMLETELLKLVDASSILISDSSRGASDPSLPVTPRTAAVYKSDVGDHHAKTYARRSSLDYGGVALDGSKRDLLKAMETRKMMLLNEQKKAFAHALAAGFNVACISDLMVFANCFGAPRLWEGCLKFMSLCKKRQDGLEGAFAENASPASSSSGCTIQLMANSSGSEGSCASSKSKSRARKTWDPQVMSTLQQLYSRKVENGSSLMSPDHARRSAKVTKESEEDLVIGARESVSNPQLLFARPQEEAQRSVEERRISVQAAINLFESKQKQVVEAVARKKAPETQPQVTNLEPQVTIVAGGDGENDDLESILLEEAPATLPVHYGMHKPLQVVSEAAAELENIQWKPSSGYTFDDMFLDGKSAAQTARRQSLCSWKTNWDGDFEVVVSSSEDGVKQQQTGGFLQQYQERRQAKLKLEPNIKKTERDAKLKAMHEVLEKRKAEMARGAPKLAAAASSATKKDPSLRRSSSSAPPALPKVEVGFSRSRRSPGNSQHSSTSTTPRLSGCDSKSRLQLQRRPSIEGVFIPGKENVAPQGDAEVGLLRAAAKSTGSENSRTKAVQHVVQRRTESGKSANRKKRQSSPPSAELVGIKLEGDDAESSCSCAVAVASTELLPVQDEADDGVSKLSDLCNGAPVETESVTEVEVSACESKTVVADVSGQNEDCCSIAEPELTHELQVGTVPAENVVDVSELAVEVENGDMQPASEPEFTFMPEAEDKAAMPEHCPTAEVEITEELVAGTGKEEEAVKTMDEVVLKWHQTNGDSADLRGKAPLFELAELDYKMSAASRVPVEPLSSSSLLESDAIESFGSSKSESTAPDATVETTTLPSPVVHVQASSSEPVSPKQRLPLFDLLVTSTTSSQTHISRLPSPEARGSFSAQLLHSATHKKLSRSSAGAASNSSGSIVIPEMTNKQQQQHKETGLRGLKRFLGFGRKNSRGDKKIMWQNGSFKE